MIYQMTYLPILNYLQMTDTSLFSVVHEKNISSNQLNNDLRKISNWSYQWKMSFNRDPLKQTPP